MSPSAELLRQQILALVAEYHQAQFAAKEFIPGETLIPVSGKVFDASDMQALVDSSLDFWLTTGRFAAQFEQDFAKRMQVRHALLTNSGSSANLLALSCLTSPQLGDQRLLPGDEVITVAAGFPTTVNPIVQNQLIPVFVDVSVPTYNVDVSQLDMALSDRTRAVMLAHTLGNPFDLTAVQEFCNAHDLYLIEDCCDALGSTYQNAPVGTFGDLATVSFYPAHHITMGEGGCVLTSQSQLKKLVESFRDWGRDCWCAPGQDNTCTKRFDWQLGDLPHGFDHKYIYSHIGYNLKLTDMQAAVGVSQLQKLNSFIEARQQNFLRLYTGLKDLESFLILPEATVGSEPSWFGFPLAVRKEAPFSRHQLIHYLEMHKIATRLLFGGNLIRQPAYRGIPYRAVGTLENSDFVMEQVFWIGLYPGLTQQHLDYMLNVLHEAVAELTGTYSLTGKQ